MPRGKAQASLALIDAAFEILHEIQPASVRAVCYQLFNRRLITSMSKNDTNRVSRQLADARERGDIPWHWIVDETREAESTTAWTNLSAYIDTVKRSYRRNRWQAQPTHLEVWSEKGTVRGTLAPVLDQFGVTFRVMHGYASATTIYEIAMAYVKGDRWLHALYVGDRDPSGLHMSEVDLPSRLQRYSGGCNISLHRVALTAGQVAMLDLPSFSAHEKKQDARYRWFVERYGTTCWELDALSPVLLREAVSRAIEQRIDWAAWQQDETAEQAETESIASILDRWPGISGQASKC